MAQANVMKGDRWGMDPAFDYTELPYLPGWEPAQGRAWAGKFVDSVGREDYQGFQAEFLAQHPRMIGDGGVVAHMPSSVTKYLRHSSAGKRMDIDWKLAYEPLPELERQTIAAAKEREITERREALRAAQDKARTAAKRELKRHIKEAEAEEDQSVADQLVAAMDSEGGPAKGA